MLRVIGCLAWGHDPSLLGLAVIVCAAASAAAAAMLARGRMAARADQRRGWLLGAAAAFGSGVWATHFVALLAFRSPVPISYAIAPTILSLAVAVLGSVGALLVREALGRAGSAAGGALLGGSIWAMHAIGVDAMSLPGLLAVDASLAAASLALGVGLSALALEAARRRADGRTSAAAAALLALSVCGLHLTGMAGIEIAPGPGEAAADGVMGSTALVVTVCLLLSVFDRHLSERAAREAETIRHMAHHDALTGLPNRVTLGLRLKEAIAEDRHGGLAVLCLDLDRFKAVNDMLGHQGGDQLLVQVAVRLREAVRATDTVARLGGDEFAIVQRGAAQPETAEALARRVVQALSQPFDLEGHSVSIGTSVGVALHPLDGETPEALLRNADTALYRAKQDGRGTWRFFEAAMEQRLLERRSLEGDLRDAVSSGKQLELHYQPIVGCEDGETVGFEALLRWNHPTRGRIHPADFIPLAEESGLILPLGRWVLETACAEAARWSEPRRVAVNLSPAQFRQPGIAATVASALARTGLPAGRLELEVTEGVLIEDAEAALATFAELKALGVRLSLDDFGTGYSSLGYLRRFPFDKIKIDRSFVTGLGSDRESAAIVDAILGLARGLSLDVTAEGVETEGQLDILRERQCLRAQGYLLGRPAAVPAPFRRPLDSLAA